MVLMRVTDEDGRTSCRVERVREKVRRAFGRIEWPAGVQDQPFAGVRHDLYAIPADLPGPTMDRDAYGQPVDTVALMVPQRSSGSTGPDGLVSTFSTVAP